MDAAPAWLLLVVPTQATPFFAGLVHRHLHGLVDGQMSNGVIAVNEGGGFGFPGDHDGRFEIDAAGLDPLNGRG
jgi:hypothetical protein